MGKRSNTIRTGKTGSCWATDGAWAVVTGATSGIGAEFARRLASIGLNLILTGRREQMLSVLEDELRDCHGIKIQTVIGDLREITTIEKLELLCGRVDVAVLVNNAGYSLGEEFSAASIEDLLGASRVLAEVPLRTMSVTLPGMRRRGGGLIINVGSLAGRLAVPRASVYVASKAFLERISETIALEVAKHRIVVQALLPGFVKTDFHRDIDNYKEKQRSRGFIRWTSADRVVDLSLAESERARRRIAAGKRPLPRQIIVVPGRLNRFLVFLSRFTPRRLIHHAAVNRKPT